MNGVAAGAGASLALACDLVIAATSASFIQAFSRLGLVPDSGATWFLPRLVGVRAPSASRCSASAWPRRTPRTGGSSGDAWTTPSSRNSSTGWRARSPTAPTRGLVRTRQAMDAAATATLAGQLDLERDFQRELGYTDDYAEGVAAFAGSARRASRDDKERNER